MSLCPEGMSRREELEGLGKGQLIGIILTLEERLEQALVLAESQRQRIEKQDWQIEAQRERIEEQNRCIEEQRQQIAKQAQQIEEQRQCIEVQNRRIAALETEVVELRRRLRQGPPNSRNSHLPPSKDLTAGSAAGKTETGKTDGGKNQRQRKEAHRKGGRKLAENPDEIRDVYLDACPHCQAVMTHDAQQVQHAYDHVDIPPIVAITTRVNLYGCQCLACGKTAKAAPPVDMPATSPFGPNLTLLALCLRFDHGVAYQRLSRFFGEFAGVQISRGALGNLMRRTGEVLLETATAIHDIVRCQPYLQSDETTVKVNGEKRWEWVFVSKTAVAHLIKNSRKFQVIEDFLAGNKPVGWGSDRLRAQRKTPALVHQPCVAHLIRDCNGAIERGDRTFAPKLRHLLGKVTDLYHQRADLTQRQFANRRTRLRKRIATLFDRNQCAPWQKDGHDLQRKLTPIHHELSTCLDHPDLPPTNNASEQAIRMSKVFMKIWGCLRSDWGAEHFAAIRTLINTGKRLGLTPKQSLSLALNRQFPLPA